MFSVSSSNKGRTRFMCTTCSFSPFFSLKVVEFSYRCTTQGPVHLGSSFPFVGLFREPFDPVVEAVAWHWCGNVAVFQSIEQYWHQLVLLAPIVSFAVGDSTHLDLKLLWLRNWECELMEGCVQIISHVVTG